MSFSLTRRGRIIKYLGNGKVDVVLDDGHDPSGVMDTYTVDISLPYVSPDGSILAGYPEPQTPVMLQQGQTGWYIMGYSRPYRVFDQDNSSSGGGILGDIMADFKPNRILIQGKKAANRIYLESPSNDNPRGNNEIVAGNAVSNFQLDIRRDIICHDFASEYSFTHAHREIIGTVKRDIKDNSLRGIEYSILTDRQYDDTLWEVGMDPSQMPSPSSFSGNIRNLPLAENRKVLYEFESISPEQDFEADNLEISKLDPNYNRKAPTTVQRPNSRAITFDLNLHYPNHLFEEIIGTGVDSFGNVIDLNRAALPLGKGDLSFSDNADNDNAFVKIRNEHRKAIAYHFELNSRKENGATQKVPRGENGIPDPSVSGESLLGVYEPLSVNDVDNYARDRSRFFLDIDKEGQFKLNVPMSSETGNVPLHTRYVSSPVLAFDNKEAETPNDLFLEDEGIDIYLENYTNNSVNEGVALKGLEGQVGPIDRFTGEPMRLNVVYHDIASVGYQFSKKRIENDPVGNLIRYQPDSSLNKRQGEIQFDKFITPEINITGPNANAGGRSGTMNFDGFISCSIGANTVDRQSLWLDTAGGIVSTIGRDRNGVSYLGQMDGDMLIQIGGLNIDTDASKKTDTRFIKENDTPQSGALDIRVIKSDGQLTVVRIDQNGVSVATCGRFEVMAQQDIVFKSNSNILFDAPNIGFYYKDAPTFIERNQIKNR